MQSIRQGQPQCALQRYVTTYSLPFPPNKAPPRGTTPKIEELATWRLKGVETDAAATPTRSNRVERKYFIIFDCFLRCDSGKKCATVVCRAPHLLCITDSKSLHAFPWDELSARNPKMSTRNWIRCARYECYDKGW